MRARDLAVVALALLMASAACRRAPGNRARTAAEFLVQADLQPRPGAGDVAVMYEGRPIRHDTADRVSLRDVREIVVTRDTAVLRKLGLPGYRALVHLNVTVPPGGG